MRIRSLFKEFHIVEDIPEFQLSTSIECGQFFRWRRYEQGYQIIAEDQLVIVKQPNSTTLTLQCPESEILFWLNFFDLCIEYPKFDQSLTDFEQSAVEFSRGLRIFNQDCWETFGCFILAQRNRITNIMTMIENICKLAGQPCIGVKGITYHAFPSPEELAAADLSEARLGFRQKYLELAAVMYPQVFSPDWYSLGDILFADRLQSFHGVGPKIANCVLLFGNHRLDAVPVDIWIERIIDTFYADIGRLPLKFKPYRGLMQQYMFNYVLHHPDVVGR